MEKPNVYKCSECGQYFHSTAWGRPVEYCSRCGAKLDWDEDVPMEYFESGGKMSGLISRKALCEYCLNTKDRTIDANDIMRFPSAEPERTAKVENIEDPAGMGAYGDCSECGAEVNEQYAYCPNCGAKLDWSK